MGTLSRSLALFLGLASTSVHAGWFGTDTPAASGKQPDCTSKASMAWCVMDLAGNSKGLADAPAGSLPMGANVPGALSKAADVVGVGAQTVAGVLDVSGVANISRIGAAGGVMNLLSAFRDASEVTPGLRLVSIALVPESEGDANRAIVTALTAAVRKMLGAENVELVAERHPDLKDIQWAEHLRFTGGELCGSRTCVASFRGLSAKHALKPTPFDLPAWAGQGKAHLVIASSYPNISIDGKRAGQEAVVYELTKHVPAWMYYYLPPTNVKQIASVISGNTEMFFVKPEAGGGGTTQKTIYRLP